MATDKGAQRITLDAARVLPNILGYVHQAVPARDRQPGSQSRLGIAPTPGAAAKLSTNRIAAALRRAGRSRGIDHAAAEIKAALREPQMRHLAQVSSATGDISLRVRMGRSAVTVSRGEPADANNRREREHGWAVPGRGRRR